MIQTKRCPEDVEFLNRMAWEFGAAYFDAVWSQRETEQDERNKIRAVERERLGSLLAAVRRPDTKAKITGLNVDDFYDEPKPIGVIARGKIAACV